MKSQLLSNPEKGKEIFGVWLLESRSQTREKEFILIKGPMDFLKVKVKTEMSCLICK